MNVNNRQSSGPICNECIIVQYINTSSGPVQVNPAYLQGFLRVSYIKNSQSIPIERIGIAAYNLNIYNTCPEGAIQIAYLFRPLVCLDLINTCNSYKKGN